MLANQCTQVFKTLILPYLDVHVVIQFLSVKHPFGDFGLR